MYIPVYFLVLCVRYSKSLVRAENRDRFLTWLVKKQPLFLPYNPCSRMHSRATYKIWRHKVSRDSRRFIHTELSECEKNIYRHLDAIQYCLILTTISSLLCPKYKCLRRKVGYTVKSLLKKAEIATAKWNNLNKTEFYWVTVLVMIRLVFEVCTQRTSKSAIEHGSTKCIEKA